MLYYDYNTNRPIPTFNETVIKFKEKVIDFLVQYIVEISNNQCDIISFSDTYREFQDDKYNNIIFNFYGDKLHIEFRNKVYRFNVLFDIYIDIEKMMGDCKDKIYYLKNKDICSYINMEVPKYLYNNYSIQYFKKAYNEFRIIISSKESVNQNIKSYYEKLNNYGFINIILNIEDDKFNYFNFNRNFSFEFI